MAFHVDAGHGQRVGGDVGGIDRDLGPDHGGQHRQAAVAGAQVEHLLGVFTQPEIDAAVRQQLGDEAARHDGALVHVERHALQPGLARQVGRGLAGLDAPAQQIAALANAGQRRRSGRRWNPGRPAGCPAAGRAATAPARRLRQRRCWCHGQRTRPPLSTVRRLRQSARSRSWRQRSCRQPRVQVFQDRGGRCSSAARCRPRRRVRRSCGWWRWAGRTRSPAGRSAR